MNLNSDKAYGVRIAVNRILQGSYTSEGLPVWWNRPRQQLDGKTPAEVLPVDPMAVVDLALGSLEQIAT